MNVFKLRDDVFDEYAFSMPFVLYSTVIERTNFYVETICFFNDAARG